MTQKEEISVDLLLVINAISKYFRFILLFNIIFILASYLILERYHIATFKETFIIGPVSDKERQAYDYIEVLNDQISSSIEDISRKYSKIFYDKVDVYNDVNYNNYSEFIDDEPLMSKYGVPYLNQKKMIEDLFFILNDNFYINTNKFSKNIKFLEPELDHIIADIKGIDAQAFYTLEISGKVENYQEIKNTAKNLFSSAEEELEKNYGAIFSKKIEVFRDLLKYKLLSLENEISSLNKSIDENNYIKIKFLKEQMEIAKKLGIENNQFLEVVSDDEFTLTKLNKSTLSENYYLKGYKTILAEIETMEKNNIDSYISNQVIELTKLQSDLKFYLNTHIYDEIINNLPFINKNIDFKAGIIKLDSDYEITSSKLLIFIATIVLSIILSLLIVLIQLLRSKDIKIKSD
tara:strand:- start:605 stop:1822 length:1218 start_codon:yes stop_codon:yes gene_type:complete